MRRRLPIVLAMVLIAAPAFAASQVHGPAVSAAGLHHRPCGKARCKQWFEISSFQWGEGRGITAPTHGASAREGSTSIGEITVHKPRRKSH